MNSLSHDLRMVQELPAETSGSGQRYEFSAMNSSARIEVTRVLLACDCPFPPRNKGACNEARAETEAER